MKANILYKGILLSVVALLIASCGKEEKTDCCVENQSVSQTKTFEWKMVTTWPKNYPGLGTSPKRFADHIEKMTNGRLKIKVYGAGEIVPALQVFDAVSQGTAEMGHGAAYYWKGKIPAAQFFTSVSFGMNAQEMNGWLHYGGGLELYRELYEPFNLIPFAGGNTGVQMAGWFNKEINSIEDLKGLKMRIPGLGGEVLNRVGGTAVNIPGGEIFTSLQTGVIDATEWVGPYNDLAFGLYKVSKFYYYPGWHEPGPTLELIINKQAFESLPQDLQEIVTVAARAMNQDMLDEYTARNNAALNDLVEKHHVQLRKLPDDVLKQLHAASDEVIAEQIGDDPLANKIYQSFLTFSKQARDYHEVSERAFYQARDL